VPLVVDSDGIAYRWRLRMDDDAATGGGRFAPMEVTALPHVSLVPAHGR
jgi:hypothetical protein